MFIKKIILFIVFSLNIMNSAPALTKNQQINQIKKILPKTTKPSTKKNIPPKTNTNTIKKISIPIKKEIITNQLNKLNNTLEKFYSEQKKLRAATRNQPQNQYVDIGEKCPCIGATCQCPTLPKFLTI